MADLDGEAEAGSGQRVAKDLFSGAAGGIAQVLIGQSEDIHMLYCPFMIGYLLR